MSDEQPKELKYAGTNIYLSKEDFRIIIPALESQAAQRDIKEKVSADESMKSCLQGLNQIKKELGADLGNIEASVVSRTKKVLLSQTIAELNVLIANLNFALDSHPASTTEAEES